MQLTDEQRKFVRHCKGTADDVQIGQCFCVCTESGQTIGTIRAIDPTLADDSRLINQMTRWRKQSAGYFLSEFDVTFERTQNWLKTIVLPSDDRIMFLVEDENHRRIGHYGIANLSENSLELDNGIRGETGGHSRLFYYVELLIIELGFSRLNVKQIQVGVFKDNFTARRLHRSVGFTDGKTHLLVKTCMSNNDIRYFPVNETIAPQNMQTREHVILTLDRDNFYEKYAWLHLKEEHNE